MAKQCNTMANKYTAQKGGIHPWPTQLTTCLPAHTNTVMHSRLMKRWSAFILSDTPPVFSQFFFFDSIFHKKCKNRKRSPVFHLACIIQSAQLSNLRKQEKAGTYLDKGAIFCSPLSECTLIMACFSFYSS